MKWRWRLDTALFILLVLIGIVGFVEQAQHGTDWHVVYPLLFIVNGIIYKKVSDAQRALDLVSKNINRNTLVVRSIASKVGTKNG